MLQERTKRPTLVAVVALEEEVPLVQEEVAASLVGTLLRVTTKRAPKREGSLGLTMKVSEVKSDYVDVFLIQPLRHALL